MFEIDLYLYEDDRTFHETWGVNKQFATRGEVEVEARKMLAGPELYEAAKLALAYIEHCVEPTCEDEEEGHDGKSPEGNALRAAIAKAEGRS